MAAGILLAAVPRLAAAADVSLKASRTVVTAGDPVELELQVPDDDAQVRAMPVRPRVSIQRTGTESSMQIVNGRVSSRVIYRFRFVARDPGTYVVGPAEVELDGRVLRSGAVQVRVKRPGRERYLDMGARVTPPVVYEGQPFRYIVRADYGSALQPVGWNPPEAPGFTVLPNQERHGQSQSVTEVAGEPVERLEIARWLVAEEPGTHPLGGGKMVFELSPGQRGDGNPFNWPSSRPRRVDQLNPELMVRARPLPPVPAGESFTGLVGDLQGTWRPRGGGRDRLEGTMVLQGRGWVDQAQFDPWEQDGWRLYPERPQVRQGIADDGSWQVRVQVPVLAVPAAVNRGGDAGRPVWFAPGADRYASLRLPLPPAPAPAGVTEPAFGAGGGDGSDDPDPTAKDGAPAGPPPLAPAAPAPWQQAFTAGRAAAAGWAGLVLAVAAVAAGGWRGRRTAAPVRNRRALARAMARARRSGTAAAWEAVYDVLHRPTFVLDPAEEELRRRLADALFTPGGPEPAAAVREWEAEHGERS